MVKIFRKNRQEMLAKNPKSAKGQAGKFNEPVSRSGRYLIYAIGEIVLVVIGILIALSINNWNEDRKQRIQEKELLTNLKISFARKLDELESKNANRAKDISGINLFLDHISDSKKLLSEDEIFGTLNFLKRYHTVNEEFSIIDMLFSSGGINTISNDSLQAKLISWPDQMEEMFEEQRVVKDMVVNRLTPLVTKYVPSTNTARLNADDQYPKSPYPNDFNDLFKDRTFESLISEKRGFMQGNIEDTKTLILNAQSILKLIEEELGKD